MSSLSRWFLVARKSLAAAVLGSSLAIIPSSALAQTGVCTAITAMPLHITSPGCYRFTRSFRVDRSVPGFRSGVAIFIDANEVDLDLGGFSLIAGTIHGQGTAGVTSDRGHRVRIRNGTISGFSTAVSLFELSRGRTPTITQRIVENLRIQRSSRVPIYVSGVGDIVRGNQIVGRISSDLFITGISISGAGSRVIDNDIVLIAEEGQEPNSEVFGATISASGEGIVIERNRITSTVPFSQSVGIFIGGRRTKALVLDNVIAGMETGIKFLEPSFGAYRRNTVMGATVPFSGGTDAGENVAVP